MSNGKCVECSRIKDKEFLSKRPDYRWEPSRKARILETTKQRYWRNPEKIRARARAWIKNNPARVNARIKCREAIKLRATPQWADKEAILAIYKKASESGAHVDHVVPLRSSLVCGLHCEANLQLLDPSENISKGNRRWPDMP